jgi:hypothetical protein
MDPKEYTHDILKSTVVSLKDNFIYRVSDSLKLAITHKINKEIVENKNYEGTILKRILTKRKSTSLDDEMIYSTLQEYVKEHEIELFDDTNLVVHLRMGDIIGRTSKKLKILTNEINSYIREHDNITKIVLVTALHYGQPTKRNKFYTAGLFSYNDKSYTHNINVLLDFIKQMERKVQIQSSSIDVDLCKLAFCPHLITTEGGFGKLVKKINELHKTKLQDI